MMPCRMRVEEVSIGDYVLPGGESAALVMIEAVVRLLPELLGNPQSHQEDSHSGQNKGLLEGPSYTGDPVRRDLDVPDVLLSGDPHARIVAWRSEQSLQRTRERRPDLLGPDLPEESDVAAGEHRLDGLGDGGARGGRRRRVVANRSP